MSHDINPFMTNGFTHHYHLGKYTFIFRGIRSIFFLLFIQFTDENSLSKQYSPRWDATLCGVTSGAMLFAYVNLFSLLLFIFQDDTVLRDGQNSIYHIFTTKYVLFAYAIQSRVTFTYRGTVSRKPYPFKK